MPLHTIWLLASLLVLGASRLPIAGETNAGSNIGLKLVAEGLNAPTVLVSIPDGSGRLLIADQSGVIHLLDRDGKKSEQPFLDLRGKMVALGKGSFFIWALGEDEDGELYVLVNGINSVTHTRGKVFKLVPQKESHESR